MGERVGSNQKRTFTRSNMYNCTYRTDTVINKSRSDCKEFTDELMGKLEVARERYNEISTCAWIGGIEKDSSNPDMVHIYFNYLEGGTLPNGGNFLNPLTKLLKREFGFNQRVTFIHDYNRHRQNDRARQKNFYNRKKNEKVMMQEQRFNALFTT